MPKRGSALSLEDIRRWRFSTEMRICGRQVQNAPRPGISPAGRRIRIGRNFIPAVWSLCGDHCGKKRAGIRLKRSCLIPRERCGCFLTGFFSLPEASKETVTVLLIWKRFCSMGSGQEPEKKIPGKNIRQWESLTGCGGNLKSRQTIFPRSTKYR